MPPRGTTINTSYPTRGTSQTTISGGGGGFGDFDPFALLRGFKMPEQKKAAPVQHEMDLPRPRAAADEYDYEPTFGTLNAAGGITPYNPGQSSLSGLSPVVATGFKRVRRGG